MYGKNDNKTFLISFLSFILNLAILIGLFWLSTKGDNVGPQNIQQNYNENMAIGEFSIPDYNGNSYVVINDNIPRFTAEEMELAYECYEHYSPLDNLGRVGVAEASVGRETMPREGEARGDISGVKPTGWAQKQYRIDGKDIWIYNRAHMIMWALSAENDNELNLMTGTDYFNHEQGMLQFEYKLTDYMRNNPDNHILYRVTPLFIGDELLARGILMEAKSVEDNGAGVQFCVFIYNIQPGISIDYRDGSNWVAQ